MEKQMNEWEFNNWFSLRRQQEGWCPITLEGSLRELGELIKEIEAQCRGKDKADCRMWGEEKDDENS